MCIRDRTDTNLYRNADFTVDENEAARIQPNEVADAVLYVLGQREGLEMCIRDSPGALYAWLYKQYAEIKAEEITDIEIGRAHV